MTGSNLLRTNVQHIHMRKLSQEDFSKLDLGEKILLDTGFGEIRAEIVNGQIVEGSDSVITHLIEYTYVSHLDEEDKESVDGDLADVGQQKQVRPSLAEDVDVYLIEE